MLDPATIAQLVTENQAFAFTRARRYMECRGYLEPEDLRQAALMGMIQAARRFNPDRGVKFITYAVRWCDKYVREAAASAGPVRVPINQREIGRWGNDPIAWNSHIAVRLVPDEPNGPAEMSEDRLAQQFRSQPADEAFPRRALVEMMSGLTPRERLVLRRRFVEGQNLAEIGEVIGLSREWVRQIEVKALDKMRRVARRLGVAA